MTLLSKILVNVDQFGVPMPGDNENTSFITNCFSDADYATADNLSKIFDKPGGGDPFASYLGTPEGIVTYTPSEGSALGNINYPW